MSAPSPLTRAIELHETRMQGDIMRMRQFDGGLVPPPISTMPLDPGGTNFMLVGPARAFKHGEHVPLAPCSPPHARHGDRLARGSLNAWDEAAAFWAGLMLLHALARL